MDDPRLKVLLIEDDEDDYILTREFLAETRGDNFQLDWLSGSAAAPAAIQKNHNAVYLVDYRLGKTTASNCSAPRSSAAARPPSSSSPARATTRSTAKPCVPGPPI